MLRLSIILARGIGSLKRLPQALTLQSSRLKQGSYFNQISGSQAARHRQKHNLVSVAAKRGRFKVFQATVISATMSEAGTDGLSTAVEQQGMEPEGGAPLSKRQRKKQLKKQRDKQLKEEKKAAEKEQRKAIQQAKRREMDLVVQYMTEKEREELRQKGRKLAQERKLRQAQQKQKMQQAMTSGQRIVIDLDFDSQMTGNQVTSLCQQVAYSHAANAASQTPVHLILSSMGGAVGAALKRQLSGVENWPVTKTEESYIEAYSGRKQDLVYLSADSEHTLTELEPQKIYIIGGIVDRNIHKGLCEGKAKQQGIATARLPIQDYVDLNGNKVLTVNQVFAMLVQWVGCKDWSHAIEKTLPKRKVKKTEQDDTEWADEQMESEQKVQEIASPENGLHASDVGFEDDLALEQHMEPVQQLQQTSAKRDRTDNDGEGLTEDVSLEEQIEPKEKRQKIYGKTFGLELSGEGLTEDVGSKEQMEPKQKRQKVSSESYEVDATGRRLEDGVAPEP